MRALGTFAKFILIVSALPFGCLLLLSLPVGAFFIVLFFFRGAEWPFAIGLGLYVFGFLAPMGLVQLASAGASPSRAARLPNPLKLAAGAAAAIIIGQALLLANGDKAFFVFLAPLAAGLPPLAALALATQRLGTITTWRRLMAGLISGSTLSIFLTLLLTVFVSAFIYLLVAPLRDLAARVIASNNLENLFYSPALIFGMVEIAIVAPLVEELAKPVGAFLLARRLRSPAEAFLVGMAGGVGFAILENMLYEGAGFRVWGGIAALRGIGSPLHPLNAGLVAIGWYGVRRNLPGAWPRLLGLYGLAVGLHALWNGAQVMLYSDLGAYFFGTETWKISIYGIGQPGAVIAFLLLDSVVLWRLLFFVTEQLRDSARPVGEPLLELHLERPRRLALLAIGAALLIVPLAALYGPLVMRYAQVAMPFR